MGEFPSREHQWKAGQSGNPGGRPRGVSLVRELLDELADTRPTVDAPAGEVTRARRVVLEWLRLAINEGDLAAILAMVAYTDGRPRQSVAVETDHTLRDALLARLREQHECPPDSSHSGPDPSPSPI